MQVEPLARPVLSSNRQWLALAPGRNRSRPGETNTFVAEGVA